MINREYINKGQVDVSVKCLRLALVYRMFYENKTQAARKKDFRNFVDFKALTLKPSKLNYYLVIRKQA